MRTRTVCAVLSLGLVGSSLPAQSQAQPPRRRTGPGGASAVASPPAVSREGIEALEAQLDRAVDRVSVPRPMALLGRAATRGYRLPGYGIVFVLSPRALPGEGFEFRPRHRVEIRHPRLLPAPRAVGQEPPQPPEVESLEQQVVVLQQETEQTRRAAEEDMDRIVQDVRVRLGPGHFELAGPPPAEPPQAATPPVAPTPPAAASALAVPAPPVAVPTAPAEAPLPPAPPWKFWFETPLPGDSRSPDAVVADVREALVQALQSAGSRVGGLRPEEFVTVAVDFEHGGLLAQNARPARTLVIRARVRDCEAGARGALPKDELRRRVEVIEY